MTNRRDFLRLGEGLSPTIRKLENKGKESE